MSRQNIGASAVLLDTIAAANGAPSGDQAGRLVMVTAFPSANPKPIDWLMQVVIENTSSPPAAQDFEVDIYLWGREKEREIWGLVGIKDGQLNDGETITGNGIIVSRYFMYQNLGLFQDLYLQAANIVGADFSLRAYLWPVYNCEENGL